MKKSLITITLLGFIGLACWLSFKAGEYKSANHYRALQAANAAGMLTAVDRPEINQQLFKDIVYRMHVSNVRRAISAYGKNSDIWYSSLPFLMSENEEKLLNSAAKTYLRLRDKLQSEFEKTGAGKAQREMEEESFFESGIEK